MTKFIRALTALTVLALMSACGGGGGSAGNTNGVALFTSASDAVTVAPGSSLTFNVGGGVPGYSATSSNGAASASVSGKTLTISGNAGGKSEVVVLDAAGSKVKIAVTVGTGVDFYTNAPDKITMDIGAVSSTYKMGGGSTVYSVVSGNQQVARVTQNGSDFYITGLSAGVTTIVMTDSLGASKKSDLTIGSGIALFSTAPSSVTISIGTSSAVYSIGGGSQIYTVSSSNNAVASVGQSSNKDFVITGRAGGNAIVTVKDNSGALVNVNVVVGTNDALFSTAAAAVNLTPGGSNTYKVGGGIPVYSVGSSNNSVATATIVGNDLTIVGVGSGTSSVVVHDATNGSLTITVTVSGTVPVALFTTAASDIIVAPSTSPSFTVGGGLAPYTVSTSDASVSTASISAASLTINGLKLGSAKITVKDAAGASITINVTVSAGAVIPLFTTSPAAVTLITGTTAAYTIGGGTSPYTVTSSNTSIVTVSAAGSSYAITGGNAGNAQVVIRDVLGTSVTVAVTITAVAQTPVDVLPGDSTGAVGDTLSFKITGGTAPFTINNNNPSITTVTQSGATFTAKLLNVGVTPVSVQDAQGQIKTINVTATAANSTLRISPAVMTIGEDSNASIDLAIYGGTAPYRAFTSDLVLSSVTVTGSTLTVGLGSKGDRCVVVKDSSGTTILGGSYVITLTVIDSLGASATATFNIKDNFKGGANCS